jgi:hypothetical protein
MKRPNITPGPWNFTKGVIPCISASIDRHQVNVAKTIYGSHDEALTNARAIAALPALLEALEKTAEALEDAREIILDLDPDAHVRTRPLSDRIAKTHSALRLAGYEF